jgi:carboxyl-terminal processing protease
MMRPRLRVMSGALTGLALALVAAGPLAAQRTAYEELQAFTGALNHIRTNYVDSVGYSELVQAAIRGMLRELDPHSTYFRAGEWAQRAALERGEVASTGAVLEDVEGMVTVLAVYPGSPAAKQGVQAGDRVVEISDTTVAGLGAPEIQLMLSGPKGSRVEVTLERGSRLDPETITLRLRRETFAIQSVGRTALADAETGYLWLSEFTEDTPREMERAIRDLRKRGARALILDLRGNPGGLVASSVGVAAAFFPKGTVVMRTSGRKADVDHEFTTTRAGEFRELPLAVLIDERSASAAEALAGSLQDHDRALILGRRSFGKALVQSPFILPNGDVIMLTMGRVLTPSGRFIQRPYRGMRTELYLAAAGREDLAGDTLQRFTTDAGRDVLGGGGIRPDVLLPGPPAVPAWLTAAADSAFDEAVADSVAHTLDGGPEGETSWRADPGRWRAALLPAFLDRARTRLDVDARPDSALEALILRHLAQRAAVVRWGVEAGHRFAVAHDPDIRAAVAHLPQLSAFISPRPR